jgi:hypothetical protein
MASADLSRRVEKVVGYPPLSEMSDHQRQESHEALLDAHAFEDVPGKWQVAILKAEANRPNLRIVGSGAFGGAPHTRARRHGAPLPCMESRKACRARTRDVASQCSGWANQELGVDNLSQC